MDNDVWLHYLQECLKSHIEDSTVLVVDNLAVHKSVEAKDVTQNELNSTLVTLPANCTGDVQPLDVGVFGLLKQKYEMLWLCTSPKPKTAKEKQLLAITLLIQSYNELSTHCITCAWEKAIPKPGTDEHNN